MELSSSLLITILILIGSCVFIRYSPFLIHRFLHQDTHSCKEYTVDPTELICICQSEQQLMALQRRVCTLISNLQVKVSHIKLEANIETLTLKLAWDSDGTKGKSTYIPPNGKKIAKQLGRRFPGMVVSFDLNRGEPE